MAEQETSLKSNESSEVMVDSGSSTIAPPDVRDLLLDITRQLVGSTDQATVLQTIVEAALRIIPNAQKCVIHLLDPEQDLLIAHYCSQPSLIYDSTSGIPSKQGVAGLALASRQPIRVSDTENDERFVRLGSGSEVRSLLVAPLLAEHLPLGTISLSSAIIDAFSDQDSQYAATLAAQASVVIHQADLLSEARLQRDRSDAVIESIAGGVLIINEGGQIIRANPGIYRLLEISPDGLSLPCSIQDIPSLEVTLCDIHQIAGPYSTQIHLPSGREKTILVTPSDLRAPSRGKVIVLRDTTEERAANESRSLFISQVSHELRKPLQHILGFVGLLTEIEGLSEKDRTRFFSHIEDETYKVARLVDDLVAFSSIETGRFALLIENIHIDSLLADIIERIAPHAMLRDIKLTIDNTLGPVRVMADPMRLEQVITNLVENALRYVPAEGSVTISLEQDLSMVLVHVTDTGSGIAPEKLARIFGAYYQEARRRQRHEGMGLGLYICQQIVQFTGGTIWVESAMGKGSTFSFTIPKEPAPTE